MRTKKQISNRILSLVLALVMVLGMVSMNMLTAFAEDDTPSSNKAIMLGTSGISDPTKIATSSGNYYTPNDYIYFGVNGSDPIKWRVLDADKANDETSGGMFLLSEYLLTTDVQFEANWIRDDGDGQENPNSWQNSDAQKWCIDFAANTSAFSQMEQTAFLGVNKSDGETTLYSDSWGISELTTADKVFFLSAEELANYVGNYDRAQGLSATDIKQSASAWWLRSPYTSILNSTRSAGTVSSRGTVSDSYVNSNYAARPAFNLNLNSVLFTSAAEGGKPDGFNAVGDYNGTDWKLTLKDSSRNAFEATLSSISGNTVTVSYSGAKTGSNEYISAIIKNGSTVKYYGRLGLASGSGTEMVTLPDDFNAANGDVLYIFNEQYNGDYKTDYASELIEIVYKVSFDANGGTGTMDSVITMGTYTLPANGFDAPNGYKFSGWATTKDGTVISDTTITVTADTTLYAIWETIPAEAPTVTAGNNLMLTYKGYTEQQVSVSVDEKDGYTYTYQWYDGNDQPISGETNSTYTVQSDLTVDSYSYYCRVTAKRIDNGLTNFADSAKITVTVNKATPGVTAPTAQENLVYNGSEQVLISAGSATNGTMQYALGTDETVTGEWKTDIPKETKAGTYYVWYKVVGNDNYNDVDPAYITVNIDKAKLTISQTYTELNWYPGMGISYYSIKPYFSVTTADGTAFSYKGFTMYDSKGDEVEKLENADTYSFKFSLYNSAADNYEFENDTVTIKFNPFDLNTITEKPSMTALSPTYTGQKIFPQQTASGKLNFRIYILNPLRDAEKTTMYSLDYFDGYWEFEEISGKNCTEAGDAYVNIVGKGGNVVGSYEYKYSIKQKEMDAPVGLQAVDETISKKKDGKINGLTTAMEYSTSKYGTYKPVTDVNMLFEADTYYVRTAAPNSNYEPSDPVEITIGEGRKLTVTIPTAEEQIGYTLTVSTNEINWHGRVAITFELADGYSKSATDFAVEINGTAVTLDDYGKYNVTDAESDLKITVSGVVDETAPEVEMSVKGVGWKQFINKVTFGLFFKQNVEIKVEATDLGSKIKTAEYLITETAFTTEDAVKADTSTWTALTLDEDGVAKFNVTEKGKKYVYVRVTDNAGNITVVSSDGGMVVYTDSTADTTAISFIKTTTDDVTAKVNLNGNTVKTIYNGTDLVDSSNYSVAADETITFEAVYLDTLAEGQYTLHIVYNPQGEEYGEYKNGLGENINDEPAQTNITLTVGKQTGTVSITNDISKTYDGSAVTAPTYDRNNVSGTVVVEYKQKGADDNTYSTDAPKNAGYYTVRVTVKADDAGFYTEAVSAPVDFTIGKATLTVTVEDKTATYGDPVPTYTVKYDGFANGEDKNVLGGTLNLVCDYTQFSDKGEYTIKASGYTSDNYAINYVDGKLTISAKPIIVTIQNATSVYGDTIAELKATDDGIVNGDTNVYSLATTATSTSDVGKYAITGTALDSNYDVTFVNGEYEITKRELTITADSNSPNTGDTSNMFLWIALLFISGGAVITLTVVDRKKRMASKR